MIDHQVNVENILSENARLKSENSFLKYCCEKQQATLAYKDRCISNLKNSCAKCTEERNLLIERLSQVTLRDLNDDEQLRAGKAFAQELLHGGA